MDEPKESMNTIILGEPKESPSLTTVHASS